MINLSVKAAKRFRIDWSDLEERSGDFWKVDVVMAGRTPMLLIVHEYTLFTLVRRKAVFRKTQGVAQEIKDRCPWYRYVGKPTIGKNANPRIVGSINEIKRLTRGRFSPDQTAAFEHSINTCIYSYLSKEKYGYGQPLEAVDQYIKGQMPWLA